MEKDITKIYLKVKEDNVITVDPNKENIQMDQDEIGITVYNNDEDGETIKEFFFPWSSILKTVTIKADE